jgi:hypothetical protein
MARLHIPYPITGSIGGLVFYQRKDCKDKNFVRTQGEVAPGRQRNDAAFENRRRHSAELKGRTQMAVDLRRVLHPLEPVRTGNWQSGLAGALRPVQVRDTESVFGQRAVWLSRHGALLAGYALNKHQPLEALVRSPLEYDLDKAAGTATLRLPELVAGANLLVQGPQAWFRWVAVLGAVPDQLFVPGRGYLPAGSCHPVPMKAVYGDWHPVKGGAPATTLQLALPAAPPTDFGLVLAAGLLLGTVDGKGAVGVVRYAGAGKILAVA